MNQWNEAIETMVQFWKMKLDDYSHYLLPNVISNFKVASHGLELDIRLEELFLEKLKCLERDLLEPLEMKLQPVLNELYSMRTLNLDDDVVLRTRKSHLEIKRNMITGRIQEFERGIKCIQYYLEYGETKRHEDIPVIKFLRGKVDWERIYRIMMRECWRLDDGLPIYGRRGNIMKQIKTDQVTILIGESGSGESTQLVQFLCDSDISSEGSIICTQPHKLAAISFAERVKEEDCGCSIGFSVTSYSSYSPLQEFESKVIFMTDHCLLQHYMRDKQLSKISCIIVDETHERRLNTDLLLALIKNLLSQRPNLKLIIMSAAADADQFACYFTGCRKPLHVSGRNFPVDIKYVPPESALGVLSSNIVPSYVDDVLRMLSQIIRTEREGTILAFLTSAMEVNWACYNLQASCVIVLPLHEKYPYEQQCRVFLNYPGKRKVVIATNIAETLTIPGVKFVVDCGMVKESMYEPASCMHVLKVCRISQSSAIQQAGRAERTEPGTCYRLYSLNDFESMRPYHEPEIHKVHLSVVILKIIALA